MSSRYNEWFREECTRLREAKLFREPRNVELLPGGRVIHHGRELLHFSSNDYLGLASHPAVIAAAVETASRSGVGSRAGALVTRSRQQQTLEETLAEFEGSEAALIFPSGYAANVGVVSAIVRPGDTVFCDKENHACLIDGCRLSGAKLRVYQRTDLTKLDDHLRKASSERTLIVTDGVYSMDGTFAPLPELHEISNRHHAMLLVDEAHGTGVFGPSARGACDHFGLPDEGLIRTGTLSKALGCQGGFVTGSRALIDYLWNTARTQMFSTGLAVPICAAATKAVELVASGKVRWHAENGQQLNEFRSIESVYPTPICPIIIGEATKTIAVASLLAERGCLVGAIREPTVPRGTSRLRVSVTNNHASSEVTGLVEILRGTLAECAVDSQASA